MGDVGNEGHEASTAEEFGDEDSGMPLGFGSIDPLQARPEDTRLAATFSKHSAAVATHTIPLSLEHTQQNIYL